RSSDLVLRCSYCRQRLDGVNGTRLSTLDQQFVVVLDGHPDLRGSSEVLGQLVLRGPEVLDEVLHQDLSRMDRLDQNSLSGSRRVRHLPHLHLSRRKQSRHCEFTRLLCCPRRSPTRRSERSDRSISITERVNNATR